MGRDRSEILSQMLHDRNMGIEVEDASTVSHHTRNNRRTNQSSQNNPSFLSPLNRASAHDEIRNKTPNKSVRSYNKDGADIYLDTNSYMNK